MRIIIVATYFQRQAQLVKTLKSIGKTSHKDFEVIVVDDCSPDAIILPEVNYPVTVIRTEGKDWMDRDIPANIGFHEALKKGADIIISQNAECYHVGDVLKYAETVTDESYISFSAFSEDIDHSGQGYDINELIRANNTIVTSQGGPGWYNHPEHRPVAFDFCAAMTRNNMIRLNGFDERFSYGLAFGDDDLVRRIKILGLKIEMPTDPFVVHQYHYSYPRTGATVDVEKNYALLQEVIKIDNIKALHIKTPDYK